MNLEDIIRLYEAKRALYGSQTYRHISTIFKEAKTQHQRDFQGQDHEQSWRAFKGKNLEKLIKYILESEVQALGLKIIDGSKLERTITANLSPELSLLKRNLVIDYGEYGCHLPDVDMVIYRPENSAVLAVLSSKVTLRERIAQTGYWKLKLAQDSVTQHIKVYFITPDEDGTLSKRDPIKKARAIVEIDIDGSYVLSEAEIEESEKVKTFDKLIEDIKSLI